MTEVAAPSADDGKLFSPKVILGLVLVGVFSFAALMVFGTYAPDQQAKNDPGEHALSRSAVGYSGVIELLKASGRSTLIARGPVTVSRPSLMVLTLDGGNPKQDLGELPTTLNYKGPRLAVLPKWGTVPDLRDRGWVRKEGLAKVPAETWIGTGQKDDKIVLARGTGVGPRTLHWVADGREITTGPIDQLQVFTTMSGKGWTPVIADSRGNTVLARRDAVNDDGEQVQGMFYALSEPDLLNNQGVANLANARAGMAVLNTVEAGADPTVIFDVSLNGFGRTRSLLKLAFEPPFVAATLAAFAAALLAGWGAWIRFGAERRQGRVFALGKRALADNQAGLIRMAGREHRMAIPYAHLIRDQVARAIGAPRELAPQQLEAFLDRVGQTRGVTDQISDLTSKAAMISGPSDLDDLADRLHQWRLQMTGQKALA